MKTLEKNVINVWGDNGLLWLSRLPEIIDQLSELWSLSDITPVDNMSFNYVAKAKHKNNPVVIKISCDKNLIEDEYRALKHFNGHGSIKVIDIFHDLNALLLEQAIPGHLLKINYLNDIDGTIEHYSNIVKSLTSQPKPIGYHTHITKWCNAIDRISDTRLPKNLIGKAKSLSQFLLNTAQDEYFCHGDLHLENIIQHKNKWLSIDPKGIVGEMAFEAAAFDLIDKTEWSDQESIPRKITTRIHCLARNLGIDKSRLFAWFFVRVIISAQWYIEDNGDPEEILKLASILYELDSHCASIQLPPKITIDLARKLIQTQFSEYANLPITSVEKQGHDNRTFRLGNALLIRMPTDEPFALKVPKEQELLPQLKPHLTVLIPEPVKMGAPSSDYPYHFSIYKWLDGRSANHIKLDDQALEVIALQLAAFLNELQNIKSIDGPSPGQHNWWRGDHVRVYDKGAREQIHALSDVIDERKAIILWETACHTKWNKTPVWIHGDFSSGNILVEDNRLSGVIDFGGMAMGDPACDLVIAWTFLKNKSRKMFIQSINLDNNTWLRAKAWALWKATFELCQIQDRKSDEAIIQLSIIDDIL